jgi:hypothetical protein
MAPAVDSSTAALCRNDSVPSSDEETPIIAFQQTDQVEQTRPRSEGMRLGPVPHCPT